MTKIFTRYETPRPDPADPRHSVDVVTWCEEGMLNIAYYSFDDGEWGFHTDTLIDMTNVNFVWMYAPDELTRHFNQ